MNELPLKGLKVLDLSHVLAGPYLTMMLGDFGAEVIKIEKPGRGDTTRGTTPFIEGRSHYFSAVNRNKYSLTIDLKKEKGRELFLELVKKADIVVNNFRPGVLDNLNLGYQKLKEVNPGIINCNISGFGITGHLKEKTSFDLITQALSGFMSVTGEYGGAPARCGVSIGDVAASTFALAAIMMSLYRRVKTGEGDNIDISMLDCLVSYLTYFLPFYQATGIIPGPVGSMHASVVPMGAYMAKDGYIAIAAFNQKFWINLCKALNKEEWISDPKFSKLKDRQKNRDELMDLIRAEVGKYTREELGRTFDEKEVPYGSVLNMAEVIEFPLLKERNMMLTIKYPDSEIEVVVANQPIKFGSFEGKSTGVWKNPPKMGADNQLILQNLLGYSKDEIDKLTKEQII